MLLGNIRDDRHSTCRTSRSTSHLVPSMTTNDSNSNSFLTSTIDNQNPMISQQAMMHYARMSYRYTTVTLLSMRPPPEITVFPDHLVERRFLDDENYIDLDRMLAEKAGKFRKNVYDMRDGAGDGPTLPTKLHKCDTSNSSVTEKVKSRRPKDPLTPHQVAALTSVVTRHQITTLPTPLLSSHQIPIRNMRNDDYQHHRQTQTQRNHISTPSLMSLHHQQIPNQNNSSLPIHLSNVEQNTNTVPILQRLFQAQQRQQNDQHRRHFSSPHVAHARTSATDVQQRSPPSFYSPSSPPQQPNSYNTFAWPFSTSPNQKPVTHPLHIPISTQATVKQNQNVFDQLVQEQLRSSSIIQTPMTPNTNTHDLKNTFQNNKSNDEEDDDNDDDEQKFYSAPPSPTHEQDSQPSLFTNSNHPEHSRIYNQAVLLNSLIRNMINENGVKNSSSNESCSSNDTQSTNWTEEQNESYTDMYNLIRLLSPGVKNVAQQELLQYLEQGCSNERNQMLELISSLNPNEQNSLKPVLLRLIHEQLEVMKNQQQIQQGNLTFNSNEFFHEARSSLENWFGEDIYRNAYPRMPSDRVISAYDLEQARLAQKN